MILSKKQEGYTSLTEPLEKSRHIYYCFFCPFKSRITPTTRNAKAVLEHCSTSLCFTWPFGTKMSRHRFVGSHQRICKECQGKLLSQNGRSLTFIGGFEQDRRKRPYSRKCSPSILSLLHPFSRCCCSSPTCSPSEPRTQPFCFQRNSDHLYWKHVIQECHDYFFCSGTT